MSQTMLAYPVSRVAALRSRLVPADRDGRIFNIGVGAAMLVGFVIRVTFVLVKQSKLVLTTGDAYWYHFQAKLVADGQGFLNPFLYFKDGISLPGADHPPGFVFVLAGLDLVGINSPQAQRLVMCIVGTASIWVIALLGRRIAGVHVGVLAAALTALYPNMWINDGMLLVETIYIFATAVSLLFIYRYFQRRSRWDLLVVSASLTIAAMTRPESLLLFVLVVVPLVLSRDLPWRERFTQVALAAVIPTLAFAPWVGYNLTRFNEPVTISTGAGQTLAAGNCHYTYEGERLGYYDLRCLRVPVITVPSGDPSERDPVYRRIAFNYMSEHRGQLPKTMAARVGRLWHVYQPIQSLTLDGWVEGRAGGPPSNDQTIVTAALYSYFVLMPFALAGAIFLRRRRITLWPLLVQPALATFVAALTFGITRYRAGAEITLVVLAAVSICALAEWMATTVRPDRRTIDGTRSTPHTISTDVDDEVSSNPVATSSTTDNPTAAHIAAD